MPIKAALNFSGLPLSGATDPMQMAQGSFGKHCNMDAFFLFLVEIQIDVLFALLAAMSKYLTRSWKEVLLWLVLKKGYNPVWQGRHGGTDIA